MKNNKVLYGVAAIMVGLGAAVSSWYFLIYKSGRATANNNTTGANGTSSGTGTQTQTGTATTGTVIPGTPPIVVDDPSRFYIGDVLYATTDTPLLKSASLGVSNIGTTVSAGEKIGTFLSWDGNFVKVARTEGLLFREAVNYYIYKTAKIYKK